MNVHINFSPSADWHGTRARLGNLLGVRTYGNFCDVAGDVDKVTATLEENGFVVERLRDTAEAAQLRVTPTEDAPAYDVSRLRDKAELIAATRNLARDCARYAARFGTPEDARSLWRDRASRFHEIANGMEATGP